MKHPNFFCLLFTLSLILSACAPEAQTASQPVSDDTYFPIQIGDETLQLQLALRESERTLGLMFRDELAKDHGMLFLFEEPGPLGFWMRNTRIPLDLGYFDASGKLLEIHELYPYDETTVSSHSKQVLIAVETNRGWYEAHAIRPGAQIDIHALTAAIKDRGIPTERYSIERTY